ncbi:MAG TPA: M13-type metalloendopeptidase [Xanthomonadaceae bacterium]
MNTRFHKPLSLAVLVALVGCTQQPDQTASAPGAKPAKAPHAEATADLGAASTLKASDIDTSIKPCDDFHGFVDKKWLAANPIPSDRSSWGTFEMLDERSLAAQKGIVEDLLKNNGAAAGSVEQLVGDFYASGMDEKKINGTPAIDTLKPYLAPIDAIKTPDDIAAYLRDSFSKGQGDVFAFFSSSDQKDAMKMIGYAVQGGTNLPTKDYYTDPQYKAIRDAYVAHVAKILELTGTPEADAKQQADAVMRIETRLAAASLNPTEQRDLDNQYHWESMAEADKATPHFSWEKLFEAEGVKGAEGFSLTMPKFFAEFDKMLSEVPVKDWQAFFRAHTIDAASPFLNDELAAENFNFYGKTLQGTAEDQPRWKRVLNNLNNQEGEALGQLYVKQYFTPESKAAAVQLVNNLRDSLKVRIQNLAWMSDATKKKAIDKWDALVPKIGYPDKWRDWTGLKIGRDSYFDNLVAAIKFNNDWQMGKIGKPKDRSEWGMTPQTVNAQYDPTNNDITFPAAILQPPFFDAKADDALNYGGIGAVIGHEMTHGYDDQGAQYDPQGNRKDWWTAEDKKGFEARTGKLADQFSGYVGAGGKHVNGKLTLGENIADLGGINISFDALHAAEAKEGNKPDPKIDGYTQDQRFFMNWANVWRRSFKPAEADRRLNVDPHSPANFRAIGAPSNMPGFAKAFECKSGDPMVRDGDKQVVIW